jgi:ubiquinone/menaquinone biosynthesis C-methylase UbiE
MHQWFLHEKFSRSLRGLVDVAGMSALTICGGSGMDAEFLARAGAEVMCADISLGAAKRAAERARRHGVRIAPVVADAERLPFADRSVDVVYVHDGLHHLEQPYVGLSEMLRVADKAVSITEPADARLTRMAVRARMAEDVEEAGNRVERLRLGELTAAVEDAGFRILHAERYAMFYRHHPGLAMRVLSREPLLTAARATMRTGNRVFGRLGNKLVVVAVRS